MAFTEAIAPKINGSSTIGMKKSVVLIIHVPSPKSKTAASSFDSFPTRRLANAVLGVSECKIESSTAGEILHPHPAP
jgi:hypothetical protein